VCRNTQIDIEIPYHNDIGSSLLDRIDETESKLIKQKGAFGNLKKKASRKLLSKSLDIFETK